MKQHYYAEFKNTTGSKYFLVYDQLGHLVDSHIVNSSADVYSLQVLSGKYGKLIRLSAVPLALNLPVLESEEIQEELRKWANKWSASNVFGKGVPDSPPTMSEGPVKRVQPPIVQPPTDNKAPKRFVVFQNDKNLPLACEGVRWMNGSITIVTNGLHRSYATWTEFYDQYLKVNLWNQEFIWIDDENKSRAAANKLLGFVKEANALSKRASELIDTMANGQ